MKIGALLLKIGPRKWPQTHTRVRLHWDLNSQVTVDVKREKNNSAGYYLGEGPSPLTEFCRTIWVDSTFARKKLRFSCCESVSCSCETWLRMCWVFLFWTKLFFHINIKTSGCCLACDQHPCTDDVSSSHLPLPMQLECGHLWCFLMPFQKASSTGLESMQEKGWGDSLLQRVWLQMQYEVCAQLNKVCDARHGRICHNATEVARNC